MERAFKTLQGRVPPEMRLANIKTISEANKHLNQVLLPQLKELFALDDSEIESAFIPLPPSISLDDEFYALEKRRIKNDHTLNLHGQIYDLLRMGEQNYSGKEVEIRSYPNGKVRYFVDDKEVYMRDALQRAG